MVDTKLRKGLMSSRFFVREQSTQIICTRHTPTYDKDLLWIAAADYYVYFYIIVLFPLTSILQLINFTVSYF